MMSNVRLQVPSNVVIQNRHLSYYMYISFDVEQ